MFKAPSNCSITSLRNVEKEAEFNRYLNKIMKINGRILPIYSNVYDGQNIRSFGWIPLATGSYLKKFGMYQSHFKAEIENRVLLNIYKQILQGKFDPCSDNHLKYFQNMIVKYFIPQSASKVMIKHNKRKNQFGQFAESQQNTIQKNCIDYNEKTMDQFDLADINKDVSFETVATILASQEEFHKVECESIVFSILLSLLELDDEIHHKLLYTYYFLETMNCKENSKNFLVSQINNEIEEFFSEPIACLCEKIIKTYNSQYRFCLKIALEKAIGGIEHLTLEELAKRSAKYKNDETNWKRRINDWRCRTANKFKLHLEDNYLMETLLLDFIKTETNYFGIATFIYSRIGDPKIFDVDTLYHEISGINFEKLIQLISMKKFRNQKEKSKVEQLLTELSRHKDKYPKSVEGRNIFGEKYQFSDSFQEISRKIHLALFDRL